MDPSLKSPLAMLLSTMLCGCGAPATPAVPATASRSEGTIVGPSGGEQRFLGREREPTLIKVDSATAGARELFVFQRVLDPGSSLGRHRHRDDEMIFVHTGEVTANLGGVDRPAPPGTTIFVPGDVWMNVRNTGAKPATLLIVFAAPHMADYIRALGTRPGEPKRDLSLEILRPIAAPHGITFGDP